MARELIVVLGLLAAVSSASTNLLVRKLIHVHAAVTMSYLFAWGVVICPILAFALQHPILPSTGIEWLSLVGLGVTGFAGQAFKTVGLKWEKAGHKQVFRCCCWAFT